MCTGLARQMRSSSCHAWAVPGESAWAFCGSTTFHWSAGGQGCSSSLSCNIPSLVYWVPDSTWAIVWQTVPAFLHIIWAPAVRGWETNVSPVCLHGLQSASFPHSTASFFSWLPSLETTWNNFRSPTQCRGNSLSQAFWLSLTTVWTLICQINPLFHIFHGGPVFLIKP